MTITVERPDHIDTPADVGPTYEPESPIASAHLSGVGEE